jgi:hypothetical protein
MRKAISHGWGNGRVRAKRTSMPVQHQVKCAPKVHRVKVRESGSGLGRAQHPQMTAARDLHRISSAPAGLRRTLLRPSRLPHSVGKGFQIIPAGPGRTGTVGEPDDLPAARCREALGVLGTQVVAVGLGVGGERAEDCGRVGIDVRQRRDGGAAASGARTATYRAHDVGRYNTLDRAATTLPQVTPPCRPVRPATRHSEPALLTCEYDLGRDTGQPRTRSPPATNPVNCHEFYGPGDIRKRAQPWPEWSSSDTPGPHPDPDRPAAWRPGKRTPRGLRFVSDGQPRTAPRHRPQASPP